MQCYIFDIDGTLADASHRIHHIKKQPKDWDSFFKATHKDVPHDHIVELLKALRTTGNPIVFVSGRPERTREETEIWLAAYGIHHYSDHGQLHLYMRSDGDRRDDDIIKFEILQQIRGEGFEPIMAFDDRDRVVRMWRANGVPCLQVAEGNF